MAILFAERMGHFAFNNLRIEATDVESTGQFAQAVEAAMYPCNELSRLPAGILDKYFEPDGENGCYRVIEKVRQAGGLSTARPSFIQGNRARLFVGDLQERAPPLSVAAANRGAADVSQGARARRAFRHRADAGDAWRSRAAV